METSQADSILELRGRYQAALTADLNHVSEAIAGIQPATELLEIEEAARRAMVEARDTLLAAIAVLKPLSTGVV